MTGAGPQSTPSEASADLRQTDRRIESSADVTVIVVTYNSARHLGPLGRALASGSLMPRRMLAVDNASADDTVDRAMSAGFEVIATGSNDGFGAACNVGLRAASTEFILICNPDVRPDCDATEQLLAVLMDSPSAAIAGATLDDSIRARRFASITSDIWIFLPSWLQTRLQRFGREISVDQSQRSAAVDYAIGAFLLCRTSALRSVNGFDEHFFLYCEEEDLSRRLHEHGWQTLLVPSAKVVHETSTSSEGVDGRDMASFLLHSQYWYYRKYRSRLYAECARCIHAACVISDCAYRWMTRQQQVYTLWTAIAAFRSTDSLRRAHEHRTAERMA